jgi:hypothetical protein
MGPGQRRATRPAAQVRYAAHIVKTEMVGNINHIDNGRARGAL